MGTQKKFPPITEIGEKYKETSFFKKKVSLKTELSLTQKINLFTRIKAYNSFYGTNFFVSFEQLGESEIFTLKKITGGIDSSVVSKVKKIIKETGNYLDYSGQFLLFKPT
jgi:hypothetical protein